MAAQVPARLTAAVAAAVTGERHRMTIGLRRLRLEDWIEDHPDHAEQLREKRAVMAAHDDVVAVLPGSEAAQSEVLALLVEHLLRRFPRHYAREGDALRLRASGERVPLSASAEPAIATAGRLVPEDLCVMRAGADGAYRLVAASLCFPSRWRLASKMGAPMLDIHAPVPGYASAIGSATDRALAAIAVERPVWRQNWSLLDSPELYQPQRLPLPEPLRPEVLGERLWVRSERQTLRRLPDSGDLLFTIRIRQTTLGALCALPGMAARLLAQIETMDAALVAYKQVSAIESDLLAYLRAAAAASAGR